MTKQESKTMKNFTIEELYGLNYEEIDQKIFEKIQRSDCVKCARRVGKTFVDDRTGKHYKKVLVTIKEGYEHGGDTFEYYLELSAVAKTA